VIQTDKVLDLENKCILTFRQIEIRQPKNNEVELGRGDGMSGGCTVWIG
jgi:hypothetical protein